MTRDEFLAQMNARIASKGQPKTETTSLPSIGKTQANPCHVKTPVAELSERNKENG